MPGLTDEDGSMVYGPVYFTRMADSSLVMSVRVYFDRKLNILELRDDINTRVFTALEKAGIEIPYAFTNIVMRKAPE